MYAFKVGKPDQIEDSAGPDLANLIYPTLLIVAIAILLVALGWYQQLSLRTEVFEKAELNSTDEKDDSAG